MFNFERLSQNLSNKNMKKEKILDSKEKPEKIEKKEIDKELIENAKKAFQEFLEIKPNEKVLLITEKNCNQKLENLLIQSFKELPIKFDKITIDKKTKSEDLEKIAFEHDLIIDINNNNDIEADWDIFDDIKNTKSRMVYLPNLDIESFRKGGAMTESRSALETRLNRMENRVKDAVGLKITTSYGTNLEIKLRPSKARRWIKDTGVINRPGQWDNLPGGELFTVPDEEGVNGRLVLPVLSEDVAPDQGVDEFVYLNVKNGKITSIRGGKSAEKLRKNSKNCPFPTKP